jgi:hypothetical protein
MANHFLGSFGWSCSVAKLEDCTREAAGGAGFSAEAECVVEIHVFSGVGASDELVSVGTGRARIDGDSRATALQRAKKAAVTNARKDAFSRVMLVLLPPGRRSRERSASQGSQERRQRARGNRTFRGRVSAHACGVDLLS